MYATYPHSGIVVWNFPASTSVTHGLPSESSFRSTENAPFGVFARARTAFSAVLSIAPPRTILATEGVPVMPDGEMCLNGYSSLSLQYEVTSSPSDQMLSQAMFLPGRNSCTMNSSGFTPFDIQSATQ